MLQQPIKQKKAQQHEPSRTYLFCLDKKLSSLSREYDRTKKVLPLSQTENMPTVRMKSCIFVIFAMKNASDGLDYNFIKRTAFN